MTEPFRLRLLIALSDALQEITLDNGYKHDLGPDEANPSGRVFRGRLIFGANDPLPMLSILEVPIPVDNLPSPKGSTADVVSWELMVQGYAQDDHTNPTDPAHRLMADVRQRLALERQKVQDYEALGSKCVIDMKIGAGVVRPADDVQAKAYFWLGLTLDIAEDLADPYA